MFEKFKSIQWFDLDKREKRQLLKLLKKQRKFQVHFYENGITFQTDDRIENVIRTSPFPILNLYWFHKNNNGCLHFFRNFFRIYEKGQSIFKVKNGPNSSSEKCSAKLTTLKIKISISSTTKVFIQAFCMILTYSIVTDMWFNQMIKNSQLKIEHFVGFLLNESHDSNISKGININSLFYDCKSLRKPLASICRLSNSLTAVLKSSSIWWYSVSLKFLQMFSNNFLLLLEEISCSD